MKLMSFDVETFGTLPEYALQPYRALANDAWLTSYAVAYRDDDGELHTDGSLRPQIEDLREFLTDAAAKGAHIVAWNAPFDVAWLIALGLREEVFANKWLDAMLMWRHLTSAPQCVKQPKSYGLKAAVTEFLPENAGYEKDVEFGVVNNDLLIYNKRDAMFTLQLAEMFLERMQGERAAMLIESSCIPLVADTVVQGLTINTDAARELDTELDKTAKVSFVTLKLDQPEITPEVLASPKQLATLLFDTWNLPLNKVTDKGNASTDKHVLHELSLSDPRAALVRDYREAVNNRTKFVTSTLESVEYNGDGCTRPQAKIYGTYTGRMTYYSKQGRGKDERPTGVALHQWKRDPAFRRLISPPDGHTLLEFDFAGQEFRWMAVESGDETMLGLCSPGEDAHSYMGAKIAGMSYKLLVATVASGDKAAKNKRQLGKVANLSLQYRTSPATLRTVARTNYSLDMTEPQAAAIHATYLNTYTRVPTYWNRQIYKAKKNGYVQTLAGRRVRLADYEPSRDNTWAVESTSINFPIQGVGADQKYLALAVLRNYLPKVNGKFYFELHDGLFVVVPDAHVDRALAEIRHLLSNLPYKRAWGVDLPIQFPVDAKRGKSWGDLKEVAA